METAATYQNDIMDTTNEKQAHRFLLYATEDLHLHRRWYGSPHSWA